MMQLGKAQLQGVEVSGFALLEGRVGLLQSLGVFAPHQDILARGTKAAKYQHRQQHCASFWSGTLSGCVEGAVL